MLCLYIQNGKGVILSSSLYTYREKTFFTQGNGPWRRTATVIRLHGKYVYSTLALEREREIVKEETAFTKEKEVVCCYVHV